jgi:hypothetical protein
VRDACGFREPLWFIQSTYFLNMSQPALEIAFGSRQEGEMGPRFHIPEKLREVTAIRRMNDGGVEMLRRLMEIDPKIKRLLSGE